MTLENVATFWAWFDSVRGDLSTRQIEERAGVPRGRIGNAYGKKAPTYLICEAIADGLELRREEVFRRAGHLSRRETRAELVEEILTYFSELDETNQLRLITIAWAWARQNPDHDANKADLDPA